MRKCTLSSLMLGICCVAFPLVAQQPTITIEAKDTTVLVGQPLRIRIILKNTTDKEFTVRRSVGGGHGEHYYSITVIDPDGKPTARANQPAIAGSKMLKTVAPGGDVDEYVLLNDMFNMTSPGAYVIQATRSSPFDPAITLKSNLLSINVEK